MTEALSLKAGDRIQFRTRHTERLYRALVTNVSVSGSVSLTLDEVEAFINNAWQPSSIGMGNCIYAEGLLDVTIVP